MTGRWWRVLDLDDPRKVIARGKEGSRGWFAVDAAAETMRVSTVSRWRAGTRVNLERARWVLGDLGQVIFEAF